MLSSKNSMMKILQKKRVEHEHHGVKNVNKQLLEMKELYLGRIPTTKGVRKIVVEIKP